MAQTGSVAIGADNIHYLGDVATNAGVIVAILLAWGLGWEMADPIIAIPRRRGADLERMERLPHEATTSSWTASCPDADREKIIAIIMGA